jgi:hypothetical protein
MAEISGLLPAEKRLKACASSGALADVRSGVPDHDGLIHGQTWSTDRIVRAEVIANLALDAVLTKRGGIPPLRLAGARVTGHLDFAGGDVSRTISLEHCYFDEAPEFSDSRTRSVVFAKCSLPGLDGYRMRVEGQFDLTETIVNGPIALVNSYITGELIMNGSKILNPSGWTLFAGGLTVEGTLFARHGFESRGSMRLVGADIRGGMTLDSAVLYGSEGDALVADDLRVEGRLGFNEIVAEGAIRMPGAHINGRFSLRGATIKAPATALDCRRIVADELLLTVAAPIEGIVDLGYARLSVLCDDPTTWPADIRLDGLTYDSLVTIRGTTRQNETATGLPSDLAETTAEILPAGERLAWLRHSSVGYRPQPYEQLASFYRNVGHDDQARKVLLEKQRVRRTTQNIGGKIWGHLQDWSVGYGYRPWQAAFWLVALIALGSVVFALYPPAPVAEHVGSPHFNSVFYTIDLLWPFGQFGQSNLWTPVGSEQWFAYSLVGCGWLLATAVIAGVTRSLSRS